jgi:transposase
MPIMHARGAGLDVHNKTVVACVVTPGGQEIHTLSTMTVDL